MKPQVQQPTPVMNQQMALEPLQGMTVLAAKQKGLDSSSQLPAH
jgi:hypothetical protein